MQFCLNNATELKTVDPHQAERDRIKNSTEVSRSGCGSQARSADSHELMAIPEEWSNLEKEALESWLVIPIVGTVSRRGWILLLKKTCHTRSPFFNEVGEQGRWPSLV